MKVGDYFTRPPFVVRAGDLDPARGEESFVPFTSLIKLKSLVERTFERPISFRLVVGTHGSGKTWAFSWLWREFDRAVSPHRCLVLGIPRFEIRRTPERSFVEAVLRCVDQRYPALFPTATATATSRGSEDLRALRDHWADFDSRQVLIGNAGARVAPTEQTRGFQMTRSGDLSRLMLATFEAAHFAGYPRCLVLIDEFEAPFILDSRKDRTIFSEFLRAVYDSLIEPTSSVSRYPHVQFLFSGTEPVYRQFEPGEINRQIDQGGVMAAFLRRTEDPFLIDPPSENELKKIALTEIERTRKRRGEGFIPFDEGAILSAWKEALLNLGQFVRLASDMYLLAEEEGAQSVTVKYLERVTAQYAIGEKGSTTG